MLLVTRSTLGMKTPINNEEIDIENGRSVKDREKVVRSKRGLTLHNQALLSGLAYCLSSCGMILVNKYVLSSYNFNAGISLMLYQVTFHKFSSKWIFAVNFLTWLYFGQLVQIISVFYGLTNIYPCLQNFVAVVIVSILSFLGIITTEPLTWRLIKVWFPVNIIFVGMLVTSMFRYYSFYLMISVLHLLHHLDIRSSHVKVYSYDMLALNLSCLYGSCPTFLVHQCNTLQCHSYALILPIVISQESRPSNLFFCSYNILKSYLAAYLFASCMSIMILAALI